MDPTIELTEIKDSRIVPVDIDIVYPEPLKISNDVIEYEYVDGDDPEYRRKKDIELGPYSPSKIGNSIFGDFDAVKLANLDSIFKFTRMMTKVELKDYNYLAINPELGGYHQYIQYRILQCYGYSVSTEKKYKKMEERNVVDTSIQRFKQLNGYLINNKNSIQIEIHNQFPDGLDLIVSNSNEDQNDNILFFIAQLSLSLHLLKGNGNWIIQLRKIDQPLKDCIYLAALVYEKVTLFKPMATYYNDDIYLVCQGPRTKYIPNIDEIYNDIDKKEKYPEKIIKNNPLNIDPLLSLFSIVDTSKQYRHLKSLIYWNLPGTPEPGKNVLKYRYGRDHNDGKAPGKTTLSEIKTQEPSVVERRLRTDPPLLGSPKFLPPETTSPSRFL